MKKILIILVAIFSIAFASAQSLLAYLPADSVAVFGLQDLAQHEDKLSQFIDEYNRLGLNDSLAKLNGAEQDSKDSKSFGIMKSNPFKNLDAMDFLGQEAWFALSASKFNPIPATTIILRLSPKAVKPVFTSLEKESKAEGVEKLAEGKYSFYQSKIESEDSPVQNVSYALIDDVVIFSSDTDVMRSILRQMAGSSDPNFMASEGYGNSLAQLGNANFYSYVDYGAIASLVKPFTKGLGFDDLVNRLEKAFNTAGISAYVANITADGIEGSSLQALNPNAGDSELYALLSSNVAAKQDIRFPDGALSLSSSHVDLKGWWSYLNELTSSVPDIGMSLDEMAAMFLNVDLSDSLFSWTGDQLITVTTGVADVAMPGVASANLLGEQVYIISTTDSKKTSQKLSSLIESLATSVSSFADPEGGSGTVLEPTTQEISGVTVTSYEITDGVNVNYAITDDLVFFGSTNEAITKVLSAGSNSDIDSLLKQIPSNATTFSVANLKSTMQGTAAQIGSQIQMAAGLSGSNNLDFDAVDESSAKMEEFVKFIADRLNYSISYSQVENGQIRGHSKLDVAW
ncbi:MAG TPA: DUF3352 domain-containing protein [Trueperaceae bacterium]|nr:DUF3352 domain-containing protein [Trueperaceae bacterium]